MPFVFLLLLLLAYSELSSTEININCGSEMPITTYDNMEFLKDSDYNAGLGYGYVSCEPSPRYDTIQILHLGNTIYSSSLFQRSLFGVKEYKIDLPSGDYYVQLMMYEPIHQVPGQRSFSIYVEDNLVCDSLDIVKIEAPARVIQIREKVNVSDGVLNIKFDEHIGQSIISAIRCIDVEEFEALQAPNGFVITPSYGNNILFFQHYNSSKIKHFNIYKKKNGVFERINGEHFSPTFIDMEVENAINEYKVSITDMEGREGELSDIFTVDNSEAPNSNIKHFNVDINEDSLAWMLENKYSDDYMACTFSDNMITKIASLRQRGISTRPFHKRSWKVKFEDQDKYSGVEKLNFLSLIFDPSMIREKLFHDIISAHTEIDLDYYFANLSINGQYKGLYLTKEQEENEFLKKHGIDTAAVFKATSCNSAPKTSIYSYPDSVEIQNNYSGDYTELHNFLTFVDTASVETLESQIENKFYVIDFLKSRAIINYLSDDDQCNQNYLLIYETDRRKWRYITFDNNFAMFKTDLHILYYTEEFKDTWGCFFNIFDKLLKVPKYKYFYISFMNQLANYYYISSRIDSKIDELYELITEDAKRDYLKHSHADSRVFVNENATLKEYFIRRNANVNEQLVSTLNILIPDGISINEIMTNNRSAVATSQGEFANWIEFHNSNTIPIDLTDYRLEVKQNGQSFTHDFAVNSVVEPKSQSVFVFDKNSDSFNSINFGISSAAAEIRLVEKSTGKIADNVSVPSLKSDEAFAEINDTSDIWSKFNINTFDRSNAGMEKFVKIYINEFMPNNDSTIADESGKFEDWIELYNPNDFEVDLSGYYLSDELEETDKWRIPKGIVIEPKGYLLFWADKDEEEGDLHIDFKLSSDSGYVILSNPQNNYIIDSTYYIDADSDESFARNGDGSSEWIKAHVPTPNRSNIYYDAETRYLLKNVYPNPADDILNIYFVLHRNKNVKVRIADLLGKTVMNIYDEKLPAGEYTIETDLTDIAPGMYYLYFETKDYYEVKPFIVVR